MSPEPGVSVYVRGTKVYVAPQFGGSGLRVDMEPVITATTEEHDLASALQTALTAAASLGPAHPIPNLRTYRSPVLATAGFTSAKQFETGLKYSTVHKSPEGFRIQRYQPAPHGQGFEAKEPPVVLSGTVTMDDLAKLILKSLYASSEDV